MFGNEAGELAQRIARGEVSCEAVARHALDRIVEREPTVQAWAWLDPDAAIAAARRLDRAGPQGPLHGLPVGIKDIIDTGDMPTAYGSPIYEGHRPVRDASAVALIRDAGGLPLGKTVTTEFAYFTPGRTTNPHDPARTPGGSSSGSAAAVACGMVPLALGTQTAGSIIRPASFCGIVGYKPSFGLLDRTGIRPFAESLDTPGVLAGSVDDAAFLAGVLAGRSFDIEEAPLRIGFCRTHEADAAEPCVWPLLEEAVRRLGPAGVVVREVTLPPAFAGLLQAQKVIMAAEAARSNAPELRTAPEQVSARLRAIAAAGREIAPAELDAAHELAERARRILPEVMGGMDALLCPAAPGEAPVGLEATGDPVFSRVWTLLGLPCVTVPGLRGPAGMPVGVQLVGRMRDDARVLAAAKVLEQVLQG
ncbi:amidase [Indioceanicola profundi]|uniref:amidase n=1 Tax=Indioceanicola profundi TaxID=2220096 RepID=UPI000E6AC977|nr:amidase [Indioceanicola profundi]